MLVKGATGVVIDMAAIWRPAIIETNPCLTLISCHDVEQYVMQMQ